jgi:hypothetical protein
MSEAELVYRGKIGPATLSKPEPGWATTIPQDLEHETSAGRTVPSPTRQKLEEMIRGEGLRMQARDRSARDKVVRGGSVKGVQRLFGPGLAYDRTGGVPSWGTSNLRYAGHGTTVKEAAAKPSFGQRISNLAGRAGKAIEDWSNTPIDPVPTPTPTPVPVPQPQPRPVMPGTGQLSPVPIRQPLGMGQYRMMSQVQGADPGDLMRMAEKRKIPVSGWAKTLNNPIANLMIQMGAITAIEPLLSATGIQHPLFYMMAPWAVMSFLPEYLKKWSGIEKIRGQLMQRAKAGVLGRGQMPMQALTPQTPPIDPAIHQAKWNKFMARMPRVK